MIAPGAPAACAKAVPPIAPPAIPESRRWAGRAAASAALDAVFPSAETRYVFPELLAEGLEPHRVHAVYIHGSSEPNVWIDISSVLERKIRALQCHASQVDPEMAGEWIRAMAKSEGLDHGLDAAEAYRRIILHGDDEAV